MPDSSKPQCYFQVPTRLEGMETDDTNGNDSYFPPFRPDLRGWKQTKEEAVTNATQSSDPT